MAFPAEKPLQRKGLVDSGQVLQLLVRGGVGRCHRAGGVLATTVYFEPPVLLITGKSGCGQQTCRKQRIKVDSS